MAREVGTEGKLGGQAQVKGISGTWRDLTDNVNSMASNLTTQVRNIAQVTTAVARGDLSQKITVDAHGEILELKSTVNTMVDQLSSFADEVTRVAREVGTEGKLGGQAQVRGVSGTWRDLTENVNQLASTLTTQLRAISQVSTAVTRGDLTQRIAVEALGEVAELKDNINQMIVTLRETTEEERRAGLARLQPRPHRRPAAGPARPRRGLPHDHGRGDAAGRRADRRVLPGRRPTAAADCGCGWPRPTATWRPAARSASRPVEGLVGQAALSRRAIRVTAAPDSRLHGRAPGSPPHRPADLVVLPVLFEGEPLGVIEFAGVAAFSELHLAFLDRLVATIGVALNTILANRRTEELLAQSQRLAQELQDQSAELQRTNAELEEKAALLSEQNRNIEITEPRDRDGPPRPGGEGAAAGAGLAVQVGVPGQHEPRAAHAAQLAAAAGPAARRQPGAQPDRRSRSSSPATIHSAGLGPARAHRRHPRPVQDRGRPDGRASPARSRFDEHPRLRRAGVRAAGRGEGAGLQVELAAEPAGTAIVTDAQRLQQILRNLLSNAVKFTETGAVHAAPSARRPGPAVRRADARRRRGG